jgi:cell division protein FtsI/penicillin-binding protein 2
VSVDKDAFEKRCLDIVGDRGAVAVMDLASGQLLAATNRELLFSKRFPPGSIAKIMTGIAALEDDAVLVDSFFCIGVEIHGKDTSRCSLLDGHGWVDFDLAMIQSCNFYFEDLAKRLSTKELASAYLDMKLNEKVGVDLPGEVESYVSEPLSDSAKLEFAIGQGSSIQLTPVALLSLISGFASNGALIKPRLSQGPAVIHSRVSGAKSLSRIRHLLRDVVRRGTAKPADISSVQVAGKTGTSTILGSWLTQGWFAGFAPYANPEIAIVVYLKRGEGKDAARIAGLVFSSYFSGDYAKQ